jgi:hypothetical protein
VPEEAGPDDGNPTAGPVAVPDGGGNPAAAPVAVPTEGALVGTPKGGAVTELDPGARGVPVFTGCGGRTPPVEEAPVHVP